MEDFDEINRLTPEDTIVSIATAAVGTLPLGSFFQEYISSLLGTPLERRRNEFFQELHNRVKWLEEHRGITFEDLQSNDVFVDSILEIIPMAQRTSHQQKREAFKNALTHIALNQNPHETKTHIFIRLIDILSVTHLKVLQFVDNPDLWFSRNGSSAPYGGGTMMKILNHAFPDSLNEDIATIILTDLRTHSLILPGFTERSSMNSNEAGRRRSARLGREFLEFILFEEIV